MKNILTQEYLITSPFNEKMAIEALQKQLSSLIFKELINKQEEAIKLTFILEVIESQDN